MNTNTDNISDIFQKFQKVSLKEISSVSFQKRTDTKYVFHNEKLSDIFSDLINDYKALDSGDGIGQEYQTLYYDTDGYEMYVSHHNGLRDRFKIRCRKYMSTGEIFLELKTKNNKNITKKKRIAISSLGIDKADNKQRSFIENNTPFSIDKLHATLRSSFRRVTLVNKEIAERVTFDFDFTLLSPEGEINSKVQKQTANLCIAELKRDRNSGEMHFQKLLKKNKIYPNGFSKYCIGLSFVLSDIKNNSFKPVMQVLRKNNIIN